MKNHRIGNDINVKWSIYSNDAPYILEGLDVTLYLKDMFGKKELSGFTVQENNLLWTFAGKDQKHAGKYSLELVINEGKVGMVTVDVCNFVNLVSHSCSIGGNDAVGVETESVELQSELGTVPMVVDQELNKESEHAIANKAVTAELKKLEVILDGYTPPSQTADVEGDGVGAKTINTLVVPNVEGKMTYKIVALSEINFVSDDDEQHTFVAIANAPTGTNQVNTLAGISTSKGSAESTIAQGSTIVEGVIDTNNLGQFSGTIQDIYIRHRMRGTVQLQYALGESEEGLINAVERLEKEKVGRTELATINGQSLLEGGDIIIQGGGEGGNIVIDASLSETSENAIANKAVAAALKEKQDTLKSGVNIKTINNQSILGEGNIEIKGGGATPDWNAKEGEEGHIKNRTHYLEWTTLGTIDVTNAKSGDVIYLDFSVTDDTKMRNQTMSNRLFYDIPTGGGTFDLPVSGPSVRAVMLGDRTLQIVSDPYGIPNIIEFGDVALWPLAEEYIPHTIARTEELAKKVDADKIATINGQSLVNGGNIVIEGGEGGSYDDTQIVAKLDELSAEVGNVSEEVTQMSQLYKAEQIKEKDGEITGAIDATTGDIETNSTNYFNYYWKLKKGVSYDIRVNITRNLTSRACVAFFKGDSLPMRGDDGEVLKITEISEFVTTYTPTSDGYLLVFYKMNSLIYAESVEVQSRSYYDFLGEITHIENRVAELTEKDIEYRSVGDLYYNGFVDSQDNKIKPSSGGAKLYIIKRSNSPQRATKVFANVCTENVRFNSITFYSTEEPSDESYISAINGKTESVASLFQADFPTNWKSCLVLNMSQLSADYKIYLDVLNAIQMEDLTRSTNTESAKASLNIFKDKPFYHHLNQEQEMLKQTIPAQSLLDITFAKRLGSNLIEASIHKCSDGVYVVKHGSGGAFGQGIKAIDGQDYSKTLFSSVTSSWLRENITYDCNRKKYNVCIPTWDEFLSKCKQEAMSVKFAYTNEETLAKARKYLTDDEIFITSNSRPLGFGGTIEYVYNPQDQSVEQCIASCKKIGAPLQVTILAGAIGNMSDSDFVELAAAAHSEGYTIGVVYTNVADTIKYLGLGADGICSSFKQINLFAEGNELNISDLSDERINLSLGASYDSEDDVISMPTNSKLTIDSTRTFVNGKFCVNIRFKGRVSIKHGNINNSYANLSNYASDGNEVISYAEAINPFGLDDITNWLVITASEDTTIYELKLVTSIL